MRGLIIHIALLICVNVAFADYMGRLPSTITLNGGESPPPHNAIMDCSNGWECRFGDYSYNFSYFTNGNADSNLTLTATLPQNTGSATTDTPFYIGTMTINPHSNLTMQNFESFNLGKALHINGGSLSFSNGDFATLFNTNISVTNGGKLGIVGNGFTNKGDMTAQNSTISIFSNTAWNFGNITNNNGDITIGTNLHNVGQRGTLAHIFSGVANLINNGGKITIQGDLYNGGEVITNTQYQVKAYGGGNLVINGGSITIQGQLISEPKDGQSSSIGIYGGTLSATGGVQNLSGSTLTIGALGGKMGQIQGSVTNSGQIIINAAGAGGGNHNFITGNLTGGGSISLINGNSDFANATLTNGNKTLSVVKNDDKINAFKMSLNANESTTLGAFGDDIFTISGASSVNLKATANGVNRVAFGAFYATPLAMIDTLNADISSTPKRKTATRKIITQRAKSQTRQSRQVRKVATTNPNDINAELVLKGVSTNGANGILGGLKAGYGVDFANSRFALNVAYAYGSVSGATKGDIATFATSTKSHNFALNSQLNARFAGNFGFDLGLSGAIALTNSTRKVESTAINLDSTLKSAQNIYQIAVDSVFLYDFRIRNFTITPYLGLRQGYIAMPKFSESGSGAFGLSAEAYKAYFLDALLGAKMGFDFGNYGAILADLEYKFLAYKTQKERILRYVNATQGADTLRFGIPNAHKISVDLGYHKDFNRWYLRIDGNFSALINASKANDTNINFYAYGINARFGWRF